MAPEQVTSTKKRSFALKAKAKAAPIMRRPASSSSTSGELQAVEANSARRASSVQWFEAMMRPAAPELPTTRFLNTNMGDSVGVKAETIIESICEHGPRFASMKVRSLSGTCMNLYVSSYLLQLARVSCACFPSNEIMWSVYWKEVPQPSGTEVDDEFDGEVVDLEYVRLLTKAETRAWRAN